MRDGDHWPNTEIRIHTILLHIINFTTNNQHNLLYFCYIVSQEIQLLTYIMRIRFIVIVATKKCRMLFNICKQ